MIVKNKLWEELKWANTMVIAIQHYNSKHRIWNRRYDTFIAFTASIGAFGFLLNHIFPFISSIIIGISSFAKSLFPSFIQKEEELLMLDSISDFYIKYKNKIEKIFYDLINESIDEKEAASLYFNVKDTEAEKQSIANKLIRQVSAKEQEIIDKISDDELKKVYFDIYPKR